MSKTSKRIVLLLSVIILLAGISITVFSIAGGKEPSVQGGSFQNLYADRIELTVENTEFTLTKSTDDIESFTLTSYITVKKTQADFYGMIDSFEITDISYDNVVFTALNDVTENKTLDSLLLTSSDSSPDTFRWQVDITMSVLGKGVYNSSFRINYTTGMNKDTAQSKFIEIPVIITVA